MKLAFLFSPYICPRLLDFNNLWSSPRGLSGSDLGLIRCAEEMNKKGHDVSIFVNQINKIDKYKEINLYSFDDRLSKIDDSYDAIISWCDPNSLINLPVKPIKMVSGQLNNFSWCQPGFDEWVDIWTSPSQVHMEYQKSFNLTDPNKWSVVPNGCDPELYTNSFKKEGRVLWASSADRGLHLLLQEWSKIKEAVPAANLRILYNFDYGELESFEKGVKENSTTGPSIMELAQRIRYMKEMIPRLKSLDVELVGSVSRNQIQQEWNEATVMAFPCDTVQFTEGFSVSVLEACASYSCPIISDVDALGGVYKDVVPMVKSPVRQNISEFTNLVIKGLTDQTFRNEVNTRCRNFAEKHTWKNITAQYENLLLTHPKHTGILEPMINNVSINIPFTDLNLFESKIEEQNNLVKLNIASGPNVFPFDGWINYDREDISSYLNAIKNMTNLSAMPEHQQNVVKYLQSGKIFDFRIQDLRKNFPQHADNSVDLIYFGQALEHLNSVYEALKFLKECYRMLKPGGIIRITTPDLNLLIKAYLNGEMDKFAHEQPEFYKNEDPSGQLSLLMFGATGPNCTWDHYEGHFHLYTQTSIKKLLENCGFKEIEFYDQSGKSKNLEMAKECVDAGVSHSLIVECIK